VEVFAQTAAGMEPVEEEPGERVAGLAGRLVGGHRPVEPGAVVAWARESARPADLIIVMTDCHTDVTTQESLWEELDWYRAKVPGAAGCKFVYCVLGSRGLARPVAREGDAGMLDICGWDPSHLRILQAFLAGRF
jgi:hypothetical protein